MKAGLQHYTVRFKMEEDYRKTLDEVSKAGVKFIEFCNFVAERDCGVGLGVSAEEFKKELDDRNMQLAGALIFPSDPEKQLGTFYTDYDNFRRIAEYYAKMGSDHLSIAIDFFPSVDYIKKRCEAYNNLGKIAKEFGIDLLYHNHYCEYQRLEGKYMMDIILENTDPEYLGIEMDAYWIFRGLLDPIKMIHQYGKSGRLKAIHQKDFPLEQVGRLNLFQFVDRDIPIDWKLCNDVQSPDDFIEVGEGIMKIQEIIDAGNEWNVPYLFVEQDWSKLDQIESMKVSMNNLRKYHGLGWE